MKSGLDRHIGFNKRGIVWLLLLVFCNLMVAECLHTHQNIHGSQVVCKSDGGAVIKTPQLSCKFCDYLHHQHHTLIPGTVAFSAAPVKVIRASKVFSTQFVYVFNDLLLFSGNSPPVV